VRRNCSAKDEWKWDYVPVSLPKKEAAPIKLKEPDDYWKGDFTQVLGTYCCRKEKSKQWKSVLLCIKAIGKLLLFVCTLVRLLLDVDLLECNKQITMTVVVDWC
jgi:hypothetical protein